MILHRMNPDILPMPGSNLARVENVEVWDKTTLVLFSAQTCTIPPCIKERVYRIFILLSTKVLSCMVTAIWTDQTNCLALSLLPLKLSSSAALTPLGKWLHVVGMFIRIACTMADVALAAASKTLDWVSMVWSSITLLANWSWASC